MNRITILFLLLALIICCSSPDDTEIPDHIAGLENLKIYPKSNEALFDIQFESEEIFGETEGITIGSIAGVVVDNTGKIFIGDAAQLTIYVFNSDGNYLTSIGKEGEGPGEFRSLDTNMKVNSSHLFVYDPAQRRINLFSLASFTSFHTINLIPNNWSNISELKGAMPEDFFFISNDTFLLSFIKVRKMGDLSKRSSMYEQNRLYYYLDNKGKIISDKILEQKGSMNFSFQRSGMMTTFSYPFFGNALAASNRYHLFLAHSKDFLITIYDIDGNYQRTFYYPFKKRVLTRKEAIGYSQEEVLQNIASEIHLPDTWPALHSMKADDQSRLWVSTIVGDPEVYQWWVLDATDGSLLARFTWPRNKSIETIKNGKLYTRETDEETGLQKIVRYNIIMK